MPRNSQEIESTKAMDFILFQIKIDVF